MVNSQSFITPKNHLTPEVGVLSAFVHGSIWLKVILNIQLILLKHGFNLMLISFWVSEYSVEVSADTVLLLVEQIEVDSLGGVDVHGH